MTIQPQSASPLEIAVDVSMQPEVRVESSVVDIKRLKLVTRPSGLLNFLIYEYELENLRPFFSDLYELIDKGRQWARYRGTHKAVHDGLDFIGYSADIIDPPSRRYAWADFQLHLDRLRDMESDLLDIDRIVELSEPIRSNLRRVYYGWDIPAGECAWTVHGDAIWGDDSGARIDGSDVKWSFGREHEFVGVLDEATLTAFGTWLPTVVSDYWVDANFLWSEANYPWADPAERSRRATILGDMAAIRYWVKFSDENNALIGYRRAQAIPVRPVSIGDFIVNGIPYSRSEDDPTHLLIFARTDFGDGAGQTAKTVSVFGGTVTQDNGKLWRQDVDTGVHFSPFPADIALGETVRDRVQILLELT